MIDNDQMDEDEAPEEAATDGFAEADDGDSIAFGDDDIAAKLQAEIDQLRDSLLRARAETENVRRRAEKDKADASAYAVTSFARDMLTVSDNLRRALDVLPGDVADDVKAFAEGVELTERELLNTLERHHIRKVNPQAGEKFDPTQHQAMFEVETEEHPTGSVVQVVAAGYMIKDRLLRPAMVGVAKGAPAKVDTEA